MNRSQAPFFSLKTNTFKEDFNMSYEQVSKDLEKVIGYIHADELTDDEKKLMTEQTLDYFDNYVSPGWLKYRKSVSTNSAVLEWKDHDGVCDGLYGEEFIDCLGGFGLYMWS